MHAGRRTQHAGLVVHGALTTVAVLFSANYIISKLAMRAFHPLVFAFLRVVGSAQLPFATLNVNDTLSLVVEFLG